MSRTASPDRSARVLVHAPFGRDGSLLCKVLQRAGIEALVCPTLESLCVAFVEGAAAILVGDEALHEFGIERLRRVVGDQPAWSDMPLFIMTERREGRYRTLKQVEGLGNVGFLDRPLRAETVISTFQMALRARQRQYDVRDSLEAERQSALALARANIELRRANEDLNQFAFSASHDLQEPLRMVAVFTQMLDRDFGAELSPQAREYMRFALNGARRMEALLKDLLSYVQVVNSNEEGVALTSAGEVLEQAVENLQGSIQEAGAAVEWGPLPGLIIKRVHLLQLFQNLIGNALKYRGESAPVISISAENCNEGWRFDIRDNGIGIDPKFAQHIFGVFKRLHAGHEKYAGNGIGLAICQKIVDRYGGRIWVESKGPGTGSVFSFIFPAAEGHALAAGNNGLQRGAAQERSSLAG